MSRTSYLTTSTHHHLPPKSEQTRSLTDQEAHIRTPTAQVLHIYHIYIYIYTHTHTRINPGAHAGALALKQLRGQLSEMTRQRDALRREVDEATRRIENPATTLKAADTQKSTDSVLSTSREKPRGLVKIKEPLKERCDKEIMAAKQKVVELSSKHAIEMERLRAKLAETRGRVAVLEDELSARDHQREILRYEETLIEAVHHTQRLFDQILAVNDGVEVVKDDVLDMADAWEDVYRRCKALEMEKNASESNVQNVKRLLEDKEHALRRCLEEREMLEKEHAERVKSLESSRFI
jgi:hypothetical protein